MANRRKFPWQNLDFFGRQGKFVYIYRQIRRPNPDLYRHFNIQNWRKLTKCPKKIFPLFCDSLSRSQIYDRSRPKQIPENIDLTAIVHSVQNTDYRLTYRCGMNNLFDLGRSRYLYVVIAPKKNRMVSIEKSYR